MKHLAAVGILAAALVVGGCATDVPKLMRTDQDLQTRVMDTIAADTAMTGRLVERLLAGDDTRQSLIGMVLGNTGAAQQIMMQIATDKTRLDGVLGLAAQDSAMKAHLLTLLRGMQMAGAR